MLNVTKATALQGQAAGMLIDAQNLYSNANSLASNALGSSPQDPEALKQKAGANDSTPGTLRKLARELHTHAQALASAAKVGEGQKEAQDLAEAVGATEGAGSGPATTLRQALNQLHSAAPGAALTTQAGAVKAKYTLVKEKFREVQKQNDEGKYKDGDKPQRYKAVESAWEAFNKVYKPEELLKDEVGDGDNENSGLQQALKDLNDHSGDTPQEKGELFRKAQEVIKHYGLVDKAYKAVKALEDTYKAIPETSTQYDGVVSKFTELQGKFDLGKCKYITPIFDKPWIV